MLYSLWEELRLQYFPEREDLSGYTVQWSRRKQKRVLASVSLKRKVVRVANELNHPAHLRWLSPLLYHEMCHAVLGESVGTYGGRRQWHGAAFKKLEREHPQILDFERWVKSGGWRSAVLSSRARSFWSKIKKWR